MSTGHPGRARAALSRERIVSATVELIERDGADAVSMRRVAGLLGVAPMSLYNHVPNKAALLDAVAERIMTEVVPPDPAAADPNHPDPNHPDPNHPDPNHPDPTHPDSAAPDADWCDQARTLARGFRAVARRYPRSVLVAINREPRGSVGLRPVERALAAVRLAGFDDQTSVRLMRTFVAFILGSMLREAGAGELRERPAAEGSAEGTRSSAGQAADTTAADDTGDDTAGDDTAGDDTAADTALAVALRAGHFPHVSAVLPMLVEHDHDADFEFGLELLIGAMRAALPAAVSTPVSAPVAAPTVSSDPIIAGDERPG
ncbi:MAG: TetR/AcrR family transcriptional regulator [Pseudonocardia sp.]